MFFLLLNDLPDCIHDAQIFMYADDVAAIVEASNQDVLERKLNAVAGDLNEWFYQNGLILNVAKTNYMHFNLAGWDYTPMSISLGSRAIAKVDCTSFLGFTIDKSLTWDTHVDTLCIKVGRACFALWRLSATLDRETVKSLYFASVHSLLQYGVEFWGRAADWERAFRLQKRAVRAIVRIPQDLSACPYFKSLRIMTVPDLVIFQAALYVRNNLEKYARYGDGHRYADRLRALPRRLTKTSKLIHVMGPTVYNRLPTVITDAPSTQSFKSKLKEWLIDQSFYDCNELTSLNPTC